MSVSYTRTTWRNHIVQRSRTYNETENTDHSLTHTPAPGEIFQQGTPLNETNLNKIEQGISDCADAINTLEEVKLEEVFYSATIPISGWSGNAAPYSINLTVSGILSTDNPIVDVALTGTYATDADICNAWTGIYRIVTAANRLTVYADVIPDVPIPIRVRCLRNG